MILRKRENTGNLKRKHWIALCGELGLEGTMDVSSERDYEMNEWMYEYRNERIVRGQVFTEIIDKFIINVQK
jgi:hypothetical protein